MILAGPPGRQFRQVSGCSITLEQKEMTFTRPLAKSLVSLELHDSAFQYKNL